MSTPLSTWQKKIQALKARNEWYENTERRQALLKREHDVDYIGMGVSGGYQSARHGPSLSPGGDTAAIERVMPLLKKVAAKDAQGNPCVAPIGHAGAGHYVKMVHNGIEQGMMGAVAEAWGLMRFNLGLEHDEIGDIFKQWSATPELVGNRLDVHLKCTDFHCRRIPS
jgi:6-phosphogluconate dehydrogenase